MSGFDISDIGTTYSGTVHRISAGEAMRDGHVQAACRRDIFLARLTDKDHMYSNAEMRLRRRFENTGKFRRSEVCLNCIGPIDRAGLIR
ncbi:hypothetical protein B0F70_24345 [Rhodococcus hoagii]|uniref:hypothetical protein n=1 Tax=Rhodococcus hoagii TaxID=43767 RepID=UPI001ADD64AC|nr:hypothetical protein [Prescottella equi]MBP0080137.1 hypothetical protein [Prescottella equi]